MVVKTYKTTFFQCRYILILQRDSLCTDDALKKLNPDLSSLVVEIFTEVCTCCCQHAKGYDKWYIHGWISIPLVTSSIEERTCETWIKTTCIKQIPLIWDHFRNTCTHKGGLNTESSPCSKPTSRDPMKKCSCEEWELIKPHSFNIQQFTWEIGPPHRRSHLLTFIRDGIDHGLLYHEYLISSEISATDYCSV